MKEVGGQKQVDSEANSTTNDTDGLLLGTYKSARATRFGSCIASGCVAARNQPPPRVPDTQSARWECLGIGFCIDDEEEKKTDTVRLDLQRKRSGGEKPGKRGASWRSSSYIVAV